MLHGFDDYPVHSTPAPLLHPVTDSPNAYDRYFYNGYRTDGSLFFALALGVYPNRRVMDAAFSVVRNGVQHNLRASRACTTDRTRTAVGPIGIHIDEPMLRHRLVVDSPDHGVRAELAWTSISAVLEEPRFTYSQGPLTRMDYTRMTQFGSWTGWIELDGEHIEITAAEPGHASSGEPRNASGGASSGEPRNASGGASSEVLGCRDRSWGIRNVGAPIPGPATMPQFFWIWAPTIFPEHCTHFALNHEADGRPWHQSGAVTGRLPAQNADLTTGTVLDPSRVQRGQSADVEIIWQPGTRWAERVTTRLHRWEADPVEISYEPILRFQMSGVGYLHPEWGHGMWRGDLEVTRDTIVTDEVDPESLTGVHIQALSRARWGDRVGVGTVEQMVLGAHEPTGLTGILTGA